MKSQSLFLCLCASIIILLLPGGQAVSSEGGYDPTVLPDRGTPGAVDLVVRDKTRNSDIPLRVYLPAGKAPAPVVLFTCGKRLSRTRYS